MHYDVRHLTKFTYDFPVRFARCNLRLHPIDWDGQVVERHALKIEPPVQVSRSHDNGYRAITDRMVMTRPANGLAIESRFRVSIDRVQPIPAPGDPTVEEAGIEARGLRDFRAMAPANYLFPSPLIGSFDSIADWCAQQLSPDRGVVAAGLALAQRIKADFKYDGSATELETSPAEAFEAKRGVCQDFAQIMISGARSAGLSAAYVSGYLRTIPPKGQERLVGADATHAWVMLWCGAERGWLGFDPTNGCTVGADHIVCAIGRDYSDVSPVDGIFLGRDGQKIDVAVDVAPLQ